MNLLDHMEDVERNGEGWTATCPKCGGWRALWITDGEPTCINGCDARAIRRAAGCEQESKQDDGDKPQRLSQSDLLVRLCEGIDLFHAPGDADTGYATIRAGEHNETWRIRSDGFKRWLRRRFYESQGKAPNSQSLQDAIGTIEGKASFEGDQREVAIRLAQHQGRVYLDLCDDQWRVVEVSEHGWRIIESSELPVRFVRRRAMLPLPEPVRGGSVDELRPLVNVGDDKDWSLIVGFMIGCLRPPVGGYPVLAVNGEQGSAKSALCRCIRSLIDPNQAPLRRPPKETRDLMIAAANSWLASFDNLSGIRPELSDDLASLSTGAGFSTRKNYSDDEEKIIGVTRPIMVNGIEDVVGKSDLADRTIFVTLPVIADEHRRGEKELKAELARVRPRVLGALLSAVSMAIRREHEVYFEKLPRMADFAQWVSAAEPALPWPDGRFMAQVCTLL